ncbi:ester cyclase [Serratia sp. DD3]|uniref:ester cyclase n=1 Tax=Serratia sp. DD3 TaxID=1410619 RepID=UPI0004D3670F|nr:ester cyclase [Serratia sp. DD3]KEY59216.1 snoaL-like polyketide cyclase [Serratia sp. DD3]
MTSKIKSKSGIAIALLMSFSVFSAENKPDDFSATSDAKAPERINKTLKEFKTERENVEKNLRNFDDLDFNVYSHQKWDEMNRSHAEDIIVHYPDGTVTYGLKDHLERSKKIFAFAPDTENPIHHVRIGQGNYTAVTGVWRGTFTKPMVLSDGTVIQPTGKRFEIEMATIGRWNDKGTMDEEWLFYDDYTFMKQLGLLK